MSVKISIKRKGMQKPIPLKDCERGDVVKLIDGTLCLVIDTFYLGDIPASNGNGMVILSHKEESNNMAIGNGITECVIDTDDQLCIAEILGKMNVEVE